MGVVPKISRVSRATNSFKNHPFLNPASAPGHYIYGSRCDVYTDHEALKALFNTPRPSGKLARWGLTLQELDLRIHYRPGTQNGNADALSRCPIGTPDESEEEIRQVATLQPVVSAKGGDEDLAGRQELDPTLEPIIAYHRNGTLPTDARAARQLILEQQNFCLIDGVLYRVMRDGTLRLVPPTEHHQALFREAHAGKFGGHLREHKVYHQLCGQYWWKGMRGDVGSWCRACEVCASNRSASRFNRRWYLCRLEGRSTGLAWMSSSSSSRMQATSMASSSSTT